MWNETRFSLHNSIVCIPEEGVAWEWGIPEEGVAWEWGIPEEGVAWEWGILHESHAAVNFIDVTNLLVC